MQAKFTKLVILVLVLAMLPGMASAAISANCVWEVRSTANSANGGGFIAGASGTDYSLQDSPQVTFDGTTIAATTSGTSSTITITGYTVATTDVGNILNITGGTNFTVSRFQISSVNTGSNTWTLDRNVSSGAGSAMTGRMGGAVTSAADIASHYTAGNHIWYKDNGSVHAVTAAITLSTGQNPTTTQGHTRIRGYGSTRGDATRPTIQVTGGSTGVNIFAPGAAGISIENLILDCNATATCRGIQHTAGSYFRMRDVQVINFTTHGINLTNSVTSVLLDRVEVESGETGCSAGINNLAGHLIRSYIHDNPCTGVTTGGGGAVLTHNVIANNTGATTDGVSNGVFPFTMFYNTVYGNGRYGISNNSTTAGLVLLLGNVIAGHNVAGARGISMTSSGNMPADASYDGNCFYDNTTNRNGMDSTGGLYNTPAYTNALDQSATATPFANAGSENWTLNTAASAGAVCRNNGPFKSWPGLTPTGKPDMGAIQATYGFAAAQ
jgi:hypothetical protein